MPYKSETSGQIVLYTETFPLAKDLSFSSYIKALGEQHFPHYVLNIDKIPATENYRVEIIFIFPAGQWGLFTFPGGMLFNGCTIKYSKGEREFTIQASVGAGNILLALLIVMPVLFLFLFVLFIISTKGMSLENILVFVVIGIVIIAPLTSTYTRERNLLKRIGSLALELKKE